MRAFNQYLLVDSTQPENAYGRFAEQILLAEGFMGFTQVDLAEAPLPEWQPRDLLLVTRCLLRRAQLETILQAAARGLCAVFLQPQQLLVELLGFTPASRVVHPGYVGAPDTASHGGLPLQTHLPIPCYHPPRGDGDWQAIAGAFDADGQDAGYPAVTAGRVGQGAVALFFYDLAEAVARIRFGNPDLGGYVTNGHWPWPHAFDLFAGHLDERVAHLPQADLHAQLLASVLTDVAPYPLARLWYYEDAEYRTVGIFESDGDNSTPEQFRALAAALEERNAAGTFYLMKDTRLTENDVRSLRARGHAFAPHVAPCESEEELYFAMPAAVREDTDLFRRRFGAASPTLQCHYAPWPGYMNVLTAYLENGYRLSFAYMPSPLLWAKWLCGSGRPLKFFDRHGILHDCWQQPLLAYDDLSVVPFLRDDADQARAAVDAAIDAAIDHHHTAVPILSHPVSFCTYSSPVIEHCLDRLREAGAPIYSGDQWLQLVDRRAAVRVTQGHDDAGGLVCEVSCLQGRISVMVPAQRLQSSPSRLTVNGEAGHGCLRSRFGKQWRCVQLDSEKHGGEVHIAIAGPVPRPA